MIPQLYLNEYLCLERRGVTFEVQKVLVPGGLWKAGGKLYLTNYRIVFVADKQVREEKNSSPRVVQIARSKGLSDETGPEWAPLL